VSVNESAAGKLRCRCARPLATNQPMPAPAEEPEQTSELWLTNAHNRVQSNMSWPCGQNSQPKSGYHQRRDLRHEA
jgi:hypothetical protein